MQEDRYDRPYFLAAENVDSMFLIVTAEARKATAIRLQAQRRTFRPLYIQFRCQNTEGTLRDSRSVPSCNAVDTRTGANEGAGQLLGIEYKVLQSDDPLTLLGLPSGRNEETTVRVRYANVRKRRPDEEMWQ